MEVPKQSFNKSSWDSRTCHRDRILKAFLQRWEGFILIILMSFGINLQVLRNKSLNLKKIMNEMMSKRRIQITDLQKQEIEEKQEIRLLIRLHIFYLILLINL